VCLSGAEAEPGPCALADPPAVGDVPWIDDRIGALAGKQARQRRSREHLIRGGHLGQNHPFGQAGVEAARLDVGVGEQVPQERDVRRDAEHGGAGQRGVEAAQRGGAVRAPGGDLGEHRVVGAGDGHALGETRVDPDVRRGRLAQPEHGAAGRQEAAGGVFGVDAGLDGVPGHRGHARQPLARGDPDLPFDQVQAGDEFGDGVLDLQPGVHLHEVKLVWLVTGHEKFDRARAGVPDAAGGLDGRLAHGVPARRIQQRRRRLLDDLLMPPLQAALALAEVHHVPVGVRQDLDLDVPWPCDVPLDQQRVVAERRAGLPPGRRERGGQVAGGANHPHALATPSGGGLNQDGNPRYVLNAYFLYQLFIAHSGQAGAGHHRYPCRGDRGLGGDLVAHRLDRVGRRADEHQAGHGDGAREGGVLGEEPVAGVDRRRPGRLRRGDDRVDVQVAVGGRRRADADGLAGLADVPRARVGVAVDGDAGDAEFAQRADDPDGDLAAVGHQDLAEHRAHIRKTP
jgi:hypothetical protein